jgi:hypothetical protein
MMLMMMMSAICRSDETKNESKQTTCMATRKKLQEREREGEEEEIALRSVWGRGSGVRSVQREKRAENNVF